MGSALYLINEQSQDGINLGIDITWDGWVPTCVNFNDWGDLMAAGAMGAFAGAMIATPTLGTIGASMMGNLLSDHYSNIASRQDFSAKRHGWNGLAGAFTGLVLGPIDKFRIAKHGVAAVGIKGSVGAFFDTILDYNTLLGLDPLTPEKAVTNWIFNLGGETFGRLMGKAGRFAANGGWTEDVGELWDAILNQAWKYWEGPTKDLVNWMTS